MENSYEKTGINMGESEQHKQQVIIVQWVIYQPQSTLYVDHELFRKVERETYRIVVLGAARATRCPRYHQCNTLAASLCIVSTITTTCFAYRLSHPNATIVETRQTYPPDSREVLVTSGAFSCLIYNYSSILIPLSNYMHRNYS